MKRLFVNFKTFTPGTEFPCLVFLTYNAKILTMIVGESLVITVLSAIIGSVLGVVLCTVLGPMMNINAVFTPDIFIQAFGIAIIVGIIGGLDPAVKAIKLPPTEAWRYE